MFIMRVSEGEDQAPIHHSRVHQVNRETDTYGAGDPYGDWSFRWNTVVIVWPNTLLVYHQ